MFKQRTTMYLDKFLKKNKCNTFGIEKKMNKYLNIAHGLSSIYVMIIILLYLLAIMTRYRSSTFILAYVWITTKTYQIILNHLLM